MAKVRRYRIDRIQVRLDKSERVTDNRGYLMVWGTVVSAGQRLEYNKSDGAPRDGWIEYVPESTVFNSDAMATLENAPITLNHPPENLNTDNTSRFQVGSVVKLKRDGKMLRALHQITDQRALDAIDSGVFELSPGYTAMIDETAGESEGGRHDAVQESRVYNHHSIVPEARAGSENALDKLDSTLWTARMDGLAISKPTQNRKTDQMADETKDEKQDYELEGETFSLPVVIVDRLKTQDKALKDEKDAEHEEEEEEKEEEDNKKDEEEKDEKDEDGKKDKSDSSKYLTHGDLATIVTNITSGVEKSQAKVAKKRDAAAKQRAEVIEAARPHLAESFKCDGKSAAEIMYQAIVSNSPDMKAKASAARKDASVLRGMFAMLQTPQRKDAKPLGGSGKDQSAPVVMRMDAAVKRRTHRVDSTTRSFRRVGKIGDQLAKHAADLYEEAMEKAG